MIERCEQCGFDPQAYTSATDRTRTLDAAPVRWAWLLDAHGASPDGDDELERIRRRFRSARREEDAMAALHGTEHALYQLGRALHGRGLGAPSQAGVVAGLFASGGGVPKQPIEEAKVDVRGVVGDKQANRVHHGKPIQALCLWSADVVDRLAGEGHPILPGRAGENVSVRGVDWPSIRLGTRLRIGDVEALVTAYAIPCKKNAGWFTGGDFNRMSHERERGVSRLYASVLAGGVLRVGEPALVEPDGHGPARNVAADASSR